MTLAGRAAYEPFGERDAGAGGGQRSDLGKVLRLLALTHGKRYEDTLPLPCGPTSGYLPGANRVGIQYWRKASTTVGMSRGAS